MSRESPPLRIGLMGLGRIGRNLFRILHGREDVQIVAISDVADHKALEYLLRYDTLLGPFADPLSITEGHLYTAGRQIPMLDARDPGDADWAALGVDVVIEATGKSRTRAELTRHLDAGARRVVLCSPPLDALDATVIGGINEDHVDDSHRLVSCSSNTAHCAAPVLKILNEAFGIERAFLSSVHAYSGQQRLADVPLEEARRGRAAAENIIPQESHAAEIITELLPELSGKLTAKAINAPVLSGSVVDLVCWHRKPVTATAINEVMRTAAGTDRWAGVLRVTEDPIVSSDVVQCSQSAIFDSLATMTAGDHVSKTLSWYDNGWGYANRVVEIAERFAAVGLQVA